MKVKLLFAGLCLLSGYIFFSSLGLLWPLADIDLNCSEERIRSFTDDFLKDKEIDLQGYQAAVYLDIHEEAIDYLHRHCPVPKIQELIRKGLPLVYYNVLYKKPGEPHYYFLTCHPEKGVLCWKKSFEEDDPGEKLDVGEARKIVLAEFSKEVFFADYLEKGVNSTDLPDRRDHVFLFERLVESVPEIKIRVEFSVRGKFIAGYSRNLVVPASDKRLSRTKSAPGELLYAIGVGCMSIGFLVALIVFIRQLQERNIKLSRAGAVVLVIFGSSLLNNLFQQSRMFRHWDPLWIKWMSTVRYLIYQSVGEFWFMLVILIFIASGEAMDRELLLEKGRTFWSLIKGKFNDKDVGKSSLSGFLTGLLCGGVMTVGVIFLEKFFQGYTSIQPRGFFFYTLNSSWPSLSSILFFLKIAMIEELGYRYFAGIYLYKTFGRKWVAVIVPAVIYGLGHTVFSFLPPAEPFWGRAFVLTLVGCVWGWAFFRFDLLTVILSHLTADLFIFNWPRFASTDARLVTMAALTVAIPLIPGLLSIVFQRKVHEPEQEPRMS